MSEPNESPRVSDAERDATLRTLGDHAAVGRLTLDELEDRSGRALTAKTRGELATRSPRPGAPVVRIRIYNLMGWATIYRLTPQARGQSLSNARRLAKLADRGELPAVE